MNEEIEKKAEKAEKVSKHEIVLTKNNGKKSLKIILVISSVLMVIVIAVGIFLWREVSERNRSEMENDCFIIAPELNVVEKSKDKNGETVYNVVETASFGTVFHLKREGSSFGNKTYYKILSAAADVQKYRKKDYYIETLNDYELQYTFYLEKYNRIFPLKEVQMLPSHIKKAIVDYINDEYYFTQDANRIKSTVVFADFNMDDEQDVAVVLEDGYMQNMILVLCYNKDMKQSYVAFTDYNSGLAVIKYFKKNALIYMNSETLIKAPNNGIIYENLQKDGYKYAILYDPKTMQFKQYYQKPLSEIYAEESEDDEEYEDVEMAADTIGA
jgi:hypothetical protein